jgi:putative flippase GtrA
VNRDGTQGILARLATQLGRFGLVGVANTLVDLACSNLLFVAWRPVTAVQIAIVSVIAGVIATVHSYWLNSQWTFRDTERSRSTQVRFIAFALLGLATQAAVTLFVAHAWLQSGRPVSLGAMNIAKLAAVVAAAGVTFVGYRIAVFTPRALRDFRESMVLSGGGDTVRGLDLIALLGVATAVRLAFVAAAPVAYGDAINYSWVAWLVGHGRATEADAFWHSAFDYWQALLVPLGLSQFATLVAASLVPGVLLVVPGYLLTHRLYGRTAAIIAGLVLALHPRLVEYSVNGYAETFFLHAALWSVWALTILVRRPQAVTAAIVAGTALVTWFLVRNEAVVAVALLGGVVLAAWWRNGSRPSPQVAAALLVSAVAMVMLYAAADRHFFGSVQLFAKGSNLGRAHVEMLDPREAARETYGSRAAAVAPSAAKPAATTVALQVLKRWPRNLLYTLERLPGVLLSPLFLFALLLPALARRRGSTPGEEWPLLAFTAWPLLFYPLLQLEPRMLLPVVIGAAVFGAGALVAGGRFLVSRLQWRPLAWLPATAVVLALLPLVPFLARHTEAERGFHRDIGTWLASHVDSDVRILGDGYGYVTASGFWAGRRALPRVWTADSAELAAWTESQAPGIVILYERYLRESNPELLHALDDGLPGLVPLQSFETGRAGKVRVWATAGTPVRTAALPPATSRSNEMLH